MSRTGHSFQSVLGLRIARAGNIQGFFRPELLQCLSLQKPHMTTANFTTPFQKKTVLFCSFLAMSERIQLGVPVSLEHCLSPNLGRALVDRETSSIFVTMVCQVPWSHGWVVAAG